ncbi:MAG: metallophosphoesterase family protein [Candidatus Polarisedimenticolia bacterium]
MRTLILSDLHANVHATDAVLADARRRGYDRVVCLGDLVGYGAHPNEVIDRLRDLAGCAFVRGNHDKAACDISDGESFNDAAREALAWTRAALTPDNRAWLRMLPEGPVNAGGLLLSHGSPRDEEAYILGETDAQEAMSACTEPLALFGHTHFAGLFMAGTGQRPSALLLAQGGVVALPRGRRCLLNPGSIGQPRDHEPRASYALHDDATATVEIVRVAYDVRGARAAIVSAGLPRVLEGRLALGV